jgi:hypothetical protein
MLKKISIIYMAVIFMYSYRFKSDKGDTITLDIGFNFIEENRLDK